MAFNFSKFHVDKKEEAPKASSLSLTPLEIELLMLIIKDTTFKGEHLEPMYNLVIKLQEAYLKQK